MKPQCDEQTDCYWEHDKASYWKYTLTNNGELYVEVFPKRYLSVFC